MEGCKQNGEHGKAPDDSPVAFLRAQMEAVSQSPANSRGKRRLVAKDKKLVAAQFRKSDGRSRKVAELDFKNIGGQHFNDGPHLTGSKSGCGLVFKQGNDIKQLGRSCFHWSCSNRIAQAAACSRERAIRSSSLRRGSIWDSRTVTTAKVSPTALKTSSS